MPANTPVVTSFVANHSLNNFVGATFNVFPYHIQGNTLLVLGLYVNGVLAAEQEYKLDSVIAHPAVLIQNLSSLPGNDTAEFSSSLIGATVTLFMTNTLPTGTTLTVAASATSPVWVQVSDRSSVHSYEIVTTSTLPQNLQSTTAGQRISPDTPSIQVASDET